jgi:hypothetical protein
MVVIEGFAPTPNAILSIHEFRESVHRVLTHLRNAERALRDFEKKYLEDEFDNLANKHKVQAWLHVMGIAGGAFEIASAFFQDWSAAFKGVGSVAIQSVGIGQKFCESDIVLAQAKTEELKRKIEELNAEDQEAKQEIDEILRTTEKFIEAMAKLMGTSVNTG